MQARHGVTLTSLLMGGLEMNCVDHDKRELILMSWASGMSASAIHAAGIGPSHRAVEHVIYRARQAGDPRAARRHIKHRVPTHAQAPRQGGYSIPEPSAADAIPEPYLFPPYTPPPIRRRVSALLEDQRVPELHRARKPAAPGICERVPDPAALARAANRSPAVLSTRWADGWEGV